MHGHTSLKGTEKKRLHQIRLIPGPQGGYCACDGGQRDCYLADATDDA